MRKYQVQATCQREDERDLWEVGDVRTVTVTATSEEDASDKVTKVGGGRWSVNSARPAR